MRKKSVLLAKTRLKVQMNSVSATFLKQKIFPPWAGRFLL